MMAFSVARCRICSATSKNHLFGLFTSRGEKEQLAFRLSKLLLVPICKDDGLPQHVCRQCKDASLGIEAKLESLQLKAKETLQCLQKARPSLVANLSQSSSHDSRKRPKETSSSTGISPFTARSRPPAKKMTAKRLFETENPPPPRLDTILASLPNMSAGIDSSHPDSPELPFTDPTHQDGTHIDTQTSVQVTVSTPTKTITTKLDPKFETIARELADGHIPSIVNAVYANSSIRDELLKKYTTEVDVECSTLCKKALPHSDSPSLFRNIPVGAMPDFTWTQCIKELELHTPTLFKLFMSVSSHSDHRNTQKKGESHYPGICMAVACLLKDRNREMCGVQTLLSLLLFSSCADKKVYTRLNQVGVVASYTTTLRTVQSISKLHKVPVHEWLSSGIDIKFVGDNVDKKVGVRDLRSDHRGEMAHMYSMLVVKSRVPSTGLSIVGSSGDLATCSAAHFLPSKGDLDEVKGNLVVLVSRKLCKYVKALTPYSSAVGTSIQRQTFEFSL